MSDNNFWDNLPSEFIDETVVDVEADGYFAPEFTKRATGQIIGAFTYRKNNQTAACVILQLGKDTVGQNKEKNPIEMKAGEIMFVGVRHRLVPLAYYIEQRGRVFIETGEKTRLSNGNDMWSFKVAGEASKKSERVPPDIASALGLQQTSNQIVQEEMVDADLPF